MRWFWRLWPHNFKRDENIIFRDEMARCLDQCRRCWRAHSWHHRREIELYAEWAGVSVEEARSWLEYVRAHRTPGRPAVPQVREAGVSVESARDAFSVAEANWARASMSEFRHDSAYDLMSARREALDALILEVQAAMPCSKNACCEGVDTHPTCLQMIAPPYNHERRPDDLCPSCTAEVKLAAKEAV